MQPIFTMQYGEFAVADYLSKKIENVSVFIPASAQEKGIDLLLYRYDHNCNKANTIHIITIKRIQVSHFICGLIDSLFSKMQTGIFWLVYMPNILMIFKTQGQTAQNGIQ